MIVSCGGHGATQAASQIETFLGANDMRVAPIMAFPSREVLTKAVAGEHSGLDATEDDGTWAEHRAALHEVFWDGTIAKTLCPHARPHGQGPGYLGGGK